jgi:NTP pyrophosphatase (non-canonical NTP hydrolase)
MTDELIAHLKLHLNRSPTGEDRLHFLALALCGEAGEMANIVKKDWRGDDGEPLAHAISEIADVGNYLFMLAMYLGVDLEAAMLRKLKEVEQRPNWSGVARRSVELVVQ